jgi:hypothetical protein
MVNFFVNIIILPMLRYFQLFYKFFHCSKFFHPTLFMLFMVILLMAISAYIIGGY